MLLCDELADSVKHGRTYQSTHPMARNTEGLSKSSLLKECHITGVPASWFSEQTKKEAARLSGKGRKKSSSKQLLDDNQHSKHR